MRRLNTYSPHNLRRIKIKNNKMEKNLKSISKFLSLVLRHKPEEIGLLLDENGWANVDELIKKVNAKGTNINIDLLTEIVETNDKKRFAFNDDKTKIRASQGHSIDIDLALQPIKPPDILYHGTATRFVESILKEGLSKQQRQHVHLSEKLETATAVGARHGKPTILVVNAKQMQEDGFLFYKSENNVWLTESVGVKYIISNQDY
jgi:putative RNA 2'-phosphotransferase